LGRPKPRNLHLLPDAIALAPADAHQILACALAALEDAIAMEEEAVAAVASSLLAARASQRSNNCRAKQGLGLGEPTPPCVHQECTGNPVSE